MPLIIGLRRLISDERWREKDECCPTFSGCFAVQEEKMQSTLASLIARSKSDIICPPITQLIQKENSSDRSLQNGAFPHILET